MADPAVVVSNPQLIDAATKLVEFTSHVTAALVSTQAIQFVKGSRWIPFFNEASSSRAKSMVNAAVALVTSLGITVSFTQVPVSDVAGHLRYMIDLTGLTSVSIWSHGWHFVEEWALQQGLYTGAIKPTAVTGAPALVHAAPVPVVPVQP
jgi:hypothetical protein